MRVLGQGSAVEGVLTQHACLRCSKTWWPRRPSKPLRCPRCKSPYWDRPRRLKSSKPPAFTVNQEALQESVRQGLHHALGLGMLPSEGSEDRSLTKALEVLKEMKAAGCTWTEMAERVEQKFGTKLDKEQLKALIR